MSKFCVYMLLSKRKNNFISYVGYTNNINKRLYLHNNSKGAKFTKGNKWILIYSHSYNTKSKAMKEEYLLKHDIKKRNGIKKKFLINENIYLTTI